MAPVDAEPVATGLLGVDVSVLVAASGVLGAPGVDVPPNVSDVLLLVGIDDGAADDGIPTAGGMGGTCALGKVASSPVGEMAIGSLVPSGRV